MYVRLNALRASAKPEARPVARKETVPRQRTPEQRGRARGQPIARAFSSTPRRWPQSSQLEPCQAIGAPRTSPARLRPPGRSPRSGLVPARQLAVPGRLPRGAAVPATATPATNSSVPRPALTPRLEHGHRNTPHGPATQRLTVPTRPAAHGTSGHGRAPSPPDGWDGPSHTDGPASAPATTKPRAVLQPAARKTQPPVPVSTVF